MRTHTNLILPTPELQAAHDKYKRSVRLHPGEVTVILYNIIEQLEDSPAAEITNKIYEDYLSEIYKRIDAQSEAYIRKVMKRQQQ